MSVAIVSIGAGVRAYHYAVRPQVAVAWDQALALGARGDELVASLRTVRKALASSLELLVPDATADERMVLRQIAGTIPADGGDAGAAVEAALRGAR